MTLKAIGQIDLPAPHHLLVASDGAAHRADCGRARMGLGYVTSSGLWGLLRLGRQTRLYRDPVVVAELRAAALGCRTALSSGWREMVLLTDSEDVLRFLDVWTAGRPTVLPEGYPACHLDGKPSLLAGWARQLAAGEMVVHPRWQQGHVGHDLNELADSLAKFALRARGTGKDEARRIAHGWVEGRRAGIAAAGRGTPQPT